jgi:hypothetical protein
MKCISYLSSSVNSLGEILIIQHSYIQYWSESLKGLSHEMDFKNFDKNLQNLA